MTIKSIVVSIFVGLNVLVSANNTPAHLDVVPYPSDVTIGSGSCALDPKFDIQIQSCSADCDILQRAVQRYKDLIFKVPGSTGTVFRQNIFENRVNATVPEGSPGKLFQLNIVTTAATSVELQLGVDESYSIQVPSGTDNEQIVTLTATTTWGALQGLETFSQLVHFQSSSVGKYTQGQETGYVINWTPMSIQDAPRYPWRGLLVDTARHYISMPMMEKIVDTMSAVKLNVLHWHIVDAESFPYVSEKYPDLQQTSTYHPSASYSKDAIAHLIDYARDRGVRILPEFDTPGHTASIGQTYPDLIADCYDWLVEHYGDDLRWPMFNDVALDVTKDATKTFAKNIIDEMSQIFPDKFFHIGGDEVNQGCWNAVPSILDWMQKNGYATQDSVSGEWVYDFTGLQGSWTSYIQVRCI
jgi:hexosaminidase